VIGVYRSSRRGDASWTRVLGVLGEATVTADDDGVLTIDSSTDISGQPRHWREVGPLVYRNVVGQEHIVFKPDAAGTMQILSGAPIAILQPRRADRQSADGCRRRGGSLLILLTTLLLWPVAVVTRWHYGAGLPLSGLERLLRYAVFAVCAADLAFITGFSAIMLPAAQTVFELGPFARCQAASMQWAASPVGRALIAVVNAYVAWGSDNRGLFGRAKETIIALACVGFAWFAWSMHLLDLSLRY